MRGRTHHLARFGVLLLLAALPLTIFACGSSEEGEAKKDEMAAPEEKIARVETVTLSPVSFTDYVFLTGETAAAESVTVAAELPGRVLSDNFKEGDEVKAKQWLVRVDVRTDRTRIGQIRMSLDQARRDLKRTDGLVKKGLATPATMEKMELQVKSSEYSLRMARQGVGKSTVSSPIDGVVEKKHLSQGEYANPGMPVATIVQVDTLKIMAGLPESQLRYAKEGGEVEVKIPALDLKRKGVIKRIAVQANTKNRTFPIEIEIDNRDRSLRAGMLAEIRMVADTHKDSILVPRDALIELIAGRFVYVAKGDKVERRAIKIGVAQGRFVEVLEGLGSGDEVVVVGQRALSDGDPVKIMKRGECCDLNEGGKP